MPMKENSVVDWAEAVKLYKDGFGTSFIANKFGVASNSIRRGLLKRKIPIRSKAEAQKIALDSGRVKHPTEGKNHSVATKKKLAQRTHDTWENKSEEDKDKIRAKSKERWDNRTDEEKKYIASKAASAIRLAGQEGSALEKFLLLKIREAGYEVTWHASSTLQNEKLEIDLLLPAFKIAIEVDGPFHSQVVFTQEQYIKTVSADKNKNGLLLSAGYCVIRIRSVKKNTSNYMFEKCWEELNPMIQGIVKKFPSQENRFLQLTVE